MPLALGLWHSSLCVFALLNIVAWGLTARHLLRHAPELPANILATRRYLLWLSAAYVVGCAFRSALPMLDEPRFCLHDTILSRIAVGRSIATIAELCFVAQWALLMHEASAATGLRLVKQVARALLPLAIVAETFSWVAVLTRNNLLHAFENSCWTLGAVLALIAIAALRETADGRTQRALLAAGMAAVGAYLVFMIAVDVPMYLHRWYAGGAAQPLMLGVASVLRRCTPVRVVAVWQADMSWITLYFSTAVWLSIALIYTPPIERWCRRAGRVGNRLVA